MAVLPNFNCTRCAPSPAATRCLTCNRAAKPRRKIVTAALREILGSPALSGVTLSPEVAEEIALAAIEEVGMARFLWRVIADPDRGVRRAALPALERLFQGYYGGAAEG